MRLERVVPGRTASASLAGAILARDVSVAGRRLAKGTRLTAHDLACFAAAEAGEPLTVLLADPDEVHEDEAAVRLAAAVAGGDAGVTTRGPVQSRVDLLAAAAGVVEVRVTALERLNRLDPLEVFTVVDGQAVEPGDLVASVKVAPHLVKESVLAAGEALAERSAPLVRVRAYRPVHLAVVVKGDVAPPSRVRFEAAIRAKADGLRSTIAGIRYVEDEPDAVTEALGQAVRTGARQRPTIVLTAGGASTDPADPFFLAVDALGGRVVRRGVPAHPGSMLWLAAVGGIPIVGLPSCGAYSMATAADLLLARLIAGQPATAATVARLAHGGILARTQRFRFPAYARDLDAPDG